MTAESAVAFGVLLAEGIGDTVRVSLGEVVRTVPDGRIAEALLDEAMKRGWS